MPKYYGTKSVFDIAIERIYYLFSEFDKVVVNFSGGKDSTVLLNLTLMVAEQIGKLPVDVIFIDQEAEWQATIDYVNTAMRDPRVNPLWFQMPIRIFNATSIYDQWLKCWDPDKEQEWIRPKVDISIKENTFKTDRFAELFDVIPAVLYGGKTVAQLAGVRAEESPARLSGLTAYATYKWITWGRKKDKAPGKYTFYPLYDWSYSDIWKAIHDNKWNYCKLYDYMWQYGIQPINMRVSNVHHETAIKDLFFLQEIEPELWSKVTARLSGINTVGVLQDRFMCPKELPFMFASWEEYRDFLLDKLIESSETKAKLRKQFLSGKEHYGHDAEVYKRLVKTHIAMILLNEYHGTKLSVFSAAHGRSSKNSGIRRKVRDEDKQLIRVTKKATKKRVR